MTNLIDQLIEIYFECEDWHNTKLTRQQSENYFRKLLEKGNLITYSNFKWIIGYIEYWRINLDQLGRLLSDQPFYPMDEDISTGEICYVANIFIREPNRNSRVIQYLKTTLEFKCRNCKYITGHEMSHSKRFRIFKGGTKNGG